MGKDKQYWKGLDELHNEQEFAKQRYNEFAEKLPLGEVLKENDLELTASRRDFLKFVGFGISAATLAACTRTPIKKAIPYPVKPEGVEYGIANFYATTSGDMEATALVVKTREGRPVKIAGNDLSPYTRGGVSAVGQASILNLYDHGRLDSPRKGAAKIEWSDVDKAVTTALARGGNIRLLTGTILSPSTHQIIRDFISRYPTARHITYDGVSFSALRAAHQDAFGKAVIPGYNMERANMVVSFGADFLGTWLAPVHFTKRYVARRRTDDRDNFLYHVQFESYLSLSGSNADLRVPVKPSQVGPALVKLYNELSKGVNQPGAGASPNIELAGNSISHTASELLKNRGKSIVFCGSNDPAHQALTVAINSLLGNYGTTLDLDNPFYQYQGNDRDMVELVNEMNDGAVDTLLIYDANPAYTYPDAGRFAAGLKKVKLSVSMNDRIDETGKLVSYICPGHHYLESWGDAMPRAGYVSLMQPCIAPIFETRAIQESLLTWMGQPQPDYYEYIRNYWRTNFFKGGDFEKWWAESLHTGFIETAAAPAQLYTSNYNVSTAATQAAKGAGGDGLEVVLYEKVTLRDGRYSNNPWLQELPDPVTKVTWDNYAMISPKMGAERGLKTQDKIKITANNQEIELPVVLQPGQPYGTVAIAFGYGRDLHESAGMVCNGIGANAYPLARIVNGSIIYDGASAQISESLGTYELALTQTHHHIEGRDHVRETTLATYAADIKGWKKKGESHHHISLWKDYRYPGHKWGMAIDMNACTGCGACVVSCQAENNIPVVGKDEVRRRREMHWMRIDRYFSLPGREDVGKGKDVDITKEEYFEPIINSEDYADVRVTFQPMLCQHCDNAPCETVCPVNATNHSSEGLNQQVYNRCVGTRYCANNCPWKVRRFNWFTYAQNDAFEKNYPMNNDLGRMVLNPDVTVRIRGVMEKCTFCVQRIQKGKLDAKKEGRPLADGEIVTACQQTCPANAIVFGDMNDPNSEVSKLMRNERSYTTLDVLNTRPGIKYMMKVRNVKNETTA